MKNKDSTLPVSCGTLVFNTRGELLLGHATHTSHWDIPKGLQDAGETPLQSACRELMEETGLEFDLPSFRDLGSFAYRRDKRLHLFAVSAPASLDALDHLHCASTFPDLRTGKPVPEMDRYRWASREKISQLCAPRMAALLLRLDWPALTSGPQT